MLKSSMCRREWQEAGRRKNERGRGAFRRQVEVEACSASSLYMFLTGTLPGYHVQYEAAHTQHKHTQEPQQVRVSRLTLFSTDTTCSFTIYS